jgi:predicted metal-dependent phosphoesterase TrpH
METAGSGTQALRHSGTAFADLHLHTTHSDGTFSPQRLVEEANACDLACIALTDHDTVNGIAETAERSRATGIEFVPGIELTAAVDEREFHVLGYFPSSDGWNDPGFRAEIRKFSDARVQRIHKIVTNLNAVGVDIRTDDVFALSGQGAPGRLHVARALMHSGYVDTVDGAFGRYLRKGQPGFAPKFRISAQEAIELIHRYGGVAVFAHPGIAGLDHRIADFIRWGLDGIEVWHSKHRPGDARRYRAIAEQHHLLLTGGSDCHGMAKDQMLIGSVELAYEHVTKLKEYSKKPRVTQSKANPIS